MKKIINIFAAAAAMLSLASCEAVIDSVTKNPVFEFAGTTVYDGQSAFLGTAATCKIGWKTDNSDIVYLQYDENGKLKNIYLDGEFGGFAIHILRR